MDEDKRRMAQAAALAALAGLTAWGWLAWREKDLLMRGEELRVLAAKRYLPARSRLEAPSVAWRKVPKAWAPPGAVEDGEAALGQVTLAPFNEGEILTWNKLGDSSQSLAASVPAGQRALSLAFSATASVSGLLRPGDHVDVYLVQEAPPRAGVLQQDVTVLAVGADAGGGGQAQGPPTVTLALAPSDAALALAAAGQGRLHLALRARGDAQPSGSARASLAEVAARLARGAGRAPLPLAPAAPPAEEEPFVPRKR